VVLRDIVKPGEIAHICYPFVKSLPAIKDIIAGHAAFHPTLLGLVDLTKASPVIALLAGLAQFVQTKQLAPKHQGSDTQAQLMSGMTYIFPALTFFIGLSLPSALSLYWMVSSAMAILQQYLVLARDVRELEEGQIVPGSTTKAISAHKGKGKAKGGTS
jgi:membrane protein insertase Oxa1/YidC/SpoIIIJ